MSIETIKSQLPEYAKDIKLNLSTLAMDTSLTDQQKWGCFLACALASRNKDVIRAVEAEALDTLSEEAFTAVQAAATMMAMNNIYYRFVHLSSNKEYATMKANLRMNIIGNPGVEKTDFELWSLAVSAINGCGMCIDSHEKILLDHGFTTAQIQTAVRIASVIHAAACTLDGESMLRESNVAAAA